MKKLLTSKAFWTALVSVIAVLVMRYTAIPEEVWQSIAALLFVVVGIFTADDIEQGVKESTAEAIAEIRHMVGEMREMAYKLERK